MKPEEMARLALQGSWTESMELRVTHAIGAYGARMREEAIEAAAALAGRQGAWTTYADLARRIRAIAAPAEGPSSEYQRGRGEGLGDALEAAARVAEGWAADDAADEIRDLAEKEK